MTMSAFAPPAKTRRRAGYIHEAAPYSARFDPPVKALWITSAVEQINAVGALDDGWDGGTAARVSEGAVGRALAVLNETMAEGTMAVYRSVLKGMV